MLHNVIMYDDAKLVELIMMLMMNVMMLQLGKCLFSAKHYDNNDDKTKNDDCELTLVNVGC
jgi:hypothetical protein